MRFSTVLAAPRNPTRPTKPADMSNCYSPLNFELCLLWGFAMLCVTLSKTHFNFLWFYLFRALCAWLVVIVVDIEGNDFVSFWSYLATFNCFQCDDRTFFLVTAATRFFAFMPWTLLMLPKYSLENHRLWRTNGEFRRFLTKNKAYDRKASNELDLNFRLVRDCRRHTPIPSLQHVLLKYFWSADRGFA